jgi:hypothetical protein
MNATLKKLSPALPALVMILSGLVGGSIASKLLEPTELRLFAAVAAQRDQARAELADARKRHQIARRGIERLVEELAYVDEINRELRRQVESCPAHECFSPAILTR